MGSFYIVAFGKHKAGSTNMTTWVPPAASPNSVTEGKRKNLQQCFDIPKNSLSLIDHTNVATV